MVNEQNERTTKDKILESAADLFAEKGFTETSIRELAESIGLNSASLYHHFPTKNSILECMLEDYSAYNTDVFEERNVGQILRDNPTSDGVMACLQTEFHPDRKEYSLKVLCVLLQEQLRNPIARDFISEHIIMRAERNFSKVFNELKSLGVIKQDADPDYWMKATSGFFYVFAIRMMLGIGDNAPDFTGRGMFEMLRSTFDIMFEKDGIH